MVTGSANASQATAPQFATLASTSKAVSSLHHRSISHLAASSSSSSSLHRNYSDSMGQHGGNSASTARPRLNGLADIGTGGHDSTPRLWGMPLKYISLVTLAVQNASLAIIMHYSRVSIPPEQAYSAASAVLLNELLKGSISLAVAFSHVDDYGHRGHQPPHRRATFQAQDRPWTEVLNPRLFVARCRKLGREVFSQDCWKLSIPAILYVIQNNLQFVSASNLEAATFQVSYQMKILTTAMFSVLLLRKRISRTKWLALLALALGVGIVQIQAGGGSANHSGHHEMNPLKGFLAVVAACFTSGLAGVYFEMVLKGSTVDLWVRNVQLSLFSLLPALVPIIASGSRSTNGLPWFWSLFANFGVWAWATVLVQVLGGLVTAIVIKYADNILKGFATSLSIVLSSLASVALFGFAVTPSFVLGSSTVLAATFLYNKPESDKGGSNVQSPKLVAGIATPDQSSYPGSPIEPDSPILGDFGSEKKRLSSSGTASPRTLAAALGLVSNGQESKLAGHNETLALGTGDVPSLNLSRSASSSSLNVAGYPVQPPYYSNPHSRSPSPVPGYLQGTGSRPPGRVVPASQLVVPTINVRTVAGDWEEVVA